MRQAARTHGATALAMRRAARTPKPSACSPRPEGAPSHTVFPALPEDLLAHPAGPEEFRPPSAFGVPAFIAAAKNPTHLVVELTGIEPPKANSKKPRPNADLTAEQRAASRRPSARSRPPVQPGSAGNRATSGAPAFARGRDLFRDGFHEQPPQLDEKRHRTERRRAGQAGGRTVGDPNIGELEIHLMKTIRPALVSVAASLAAMVAAGCGSYSSGPSASGSSSSGGGSGSSSGMSSSGSTSTASSVACTLPDGSGTVCGLLAAAGNPCVAAHSTVRVLYAGYAGPLYQVCKGSASPGPNSCANGTTMDIGSVNGFADAASQDTFCAGATCTISVIYDQTPNKNDLQPSPAGGNKGSADNPANATALKISASGHEAYGVLIKPGIGYRAGCTGCGTATATGTATGDQAETEYMVTSQNNLIDGCCFDYGNAETDSHDDGAGTMEAVYFGGGVVWGTGSPGGHNNGPWAMADLENGLFAGWENNQDQNISTNTPLKFTFVTDAIVGDVSSQNGGMGRFAVYGGDATAANCLTTEYDGIRPTKSGYNPMKKQGSIILGTGGDNSDGDGGQWFEGVMASGAATATTVNAIQANIVAAAYGM
jgi:hypothetical protein